MVYAIGKKIYGERKFLGEGVLGLRLLGGGSE